ncbi:MAG: hypothetical protein J7M38_03785 [Armatimonadetes bacterium]|nr:hypothetical protein [Armatimonadota bacterium]
MSRCITAGVVVCIAAAMVLTGCGGGGIDAGGGDAGPAPAQAKYVFRIDFANNTVTTIEKPDAAAKMVDANPGSGGAEFELNMTVALSEDGTLGRRHVDATVTNNSSGSIGVNREGTVTGVDLCINSLEFQEDDGTVVDGGGMAGYHAYNPQTEMPIFRIPEEIEPGDTSSTVQLDFILPRNATVAVVDIIVRADTERHNPLRSRDQWTSTVAGIYNEDGFINGPAGAARFDYLYGLFYREDTGELLLADSNNDVIRCLADGMVSTLVYDDFLGAGGARDVAVDAEGNLVISAYSEHRIYLAEADGDNLTAIAGTGSSGATNGAGDVAQFDHPWGICVVGDDIYVADRDNGKIRKIHYGGTGSRFTSTNYTVSDAYDAGDDVSDVAIDQLGNMYIGVYGDYQIVMKPRDSGTGYVIAGTGAAGHSNGLGDSATFGVINAIALCPDRTIYVAENLGDIRRVRLVGDDPTQASDWRVDTLVDYASSAQDGDEGDGTCYDPQGLHVAADGTLWFTDRHAVRRTEFKVE